MCFIQCVEKYCKHKHKFMWQNILAKQTKANGCKGQFKEFIFYSLQVHCVPSLLPCVHLIRAKHFEPNDIQSFTLAVRIPLWWNVNLIFHKASHAKSGRCQIWKWRRTGSGTRRPRQIAQAVIQERCHIIVGVWWHSAMLGTCCLQTARAFTTPTYLGR